MIPSTGRSPHIAAILRSRRHDGSPDYMNPAEFARAPLPWLGPVDLLHVDHVVDQPLVALHPPHVRPPDRPRRARATPLVLHSRVAVEVNVLMWILPSRLAAVRVQRSEDAARGCRGSASSKPAPATKPPPATPTQSRQRSQRVAPRPPGAMTLAIPPATPFGGRDRTGGAANP